ncbi:Hypothetical predicted protein, partial [Marmota monax]
TCAPFAGDGCVIIVSLAPAPSPISTQIPGTPPCKGAGEPSFSVPFSPGGVAEEPQNLLLRVPSTASRPTRAEQGARNTLDPALGVCAVAPPYSFPEAPPLGGQWRGAARRAVAKAISPPQRLEEHRMSSSLQENVAQAVEADDTPTPTLTPNPNPDSASASENGKKEGAVVLPPGPDATREGRRCRTG